MINEFRILRLTVVLGSYHFSEPSLHVWGPHNMTRAEAEKTAREMEGQEVSGDWLGLPMQLRFPIHGRYKILKTYLYDLPEGENGAGLILADCEACGKDGFAEQILKSLDK